MTNAVLSVGTGRGYITALKNRKRMFNTFSFLPRLKLKMAQFDEGSLGIHIRYSLTVLQLSFNCFAGRDIYYLLSLSRCVLEEDVVLFSCMQCFSFFCQMSVCVRACVHACVRMHVCVCFWVILDVKYPFWLKVSFLFFEEQSYWQTRAKCGLLASRITAQKHSCLA